MASLFTKIINGEIPCHKICEDEKYFAFLDIQPINPGHTIVVPKEEVDYFFDVEDDLLGGMMVFAKGVAHAIKKAVDCQKVGVMVAGLEVPHAHVHLVPILKVRDLTFDKAQPADNEELAKIAEKIRSHI